MPAAAVFERLRADIWRAVEAQHLVSTMPLVDNDPTDQAILEDILESSKPPLPPATAGRHWLLATPFRYRPLAQGSRFRGAGDPGVFYGALERPTACAEAGYWKWRFVRDSEGLPGLESHPMTVFLAGVDAACADLRQPPWARRKKQWAAPDDYGPTQALARTLRQQGAQAIAYPSVRDPAAGCCVAVLDPRGLDGTIPRTETWYLTVTRDGVSWAQEFGERYAFRF